MFTGIIEAVGEVAALESVGGDLRIYIRSKGLDLSDVKLGDSIATNGVCLTVVELPGDGYWADVSRESVSKTRLDMLKVGDAVNLEKAMMPTSRFGGHIVSGHVDGVGEIVERRDDARSIFLQVKAPQALARYIAGKGSITVDGVSLTVNAVHGNLFDLNIVPHTAEQTLICHYRSGDKVHLEVDMVARYLERLLQPEAAAEPESGEGLTMAKLMQAGFGH